MKTTKIIVVLFFVAMLTMAITCDSSFEMEDVVFENKSGETIFVADVRDFDATEILTPNVVFNSVPVRKMEDGSSFRRKVPDDSSFIFQVLIFKQSTMDKYSKEELIQKNIFDKLYYLTYSDLEAMGFKIVYTGW